VNETNDIVTSDPTALRSIKRLQ